LIIYSFDRPFDHAQDRPFDHAQDRPFDHAQDRPFDYTQDKLRTSIDYLLLGRRYLGSRLRGDDPAIFNL